MRGLAAFLGRHRRQAAFTPIENCPSMEFRYENETTASILVWLEPWAEEFRLEPGSNIAVRIFYTHLDTIDLAQTSELFVIWLWRGCRAQIFIDGEDRTEGSMARSAIG